MLNTLKSASEIYSVRNSLRARAAPGGNCQEDWTGRQFLPRPVMGHFRTAGFEQGPWAPQGETLLCRPNKRRTGDGSGLQIP